MFFKTFHLFTIFGFRVRLDASWFLIALFVVHSMAGAFTAPPFHLASGWAVALGLFFAFGLLMSIVLHELSHSLMARRRGVTIRGITLFALGGVAEMEDEPQDPWDEFLIAVVGPLASLVIAAACMIAAAGAQALGASEAVVTLVKQLAVMNAVLAAFNMIPAFPLDGGRVLRAILWGAKRDAVWATRIAARTGQIFGAFLVGVGILMLVVAFEPGGIFYALIGWFILKAAPQSLQVLLFRRRLDSARIASFVDAQPLVVPRGLPVSELLGRVQDRADDELIPVADGTRIIGMLPLAAARAVPPERQSWRTVGELTMRLPEQAVVTSSMSAAEAVGRMQKLQLPTLLVVDAARLVGVVRWQDLRAFAEARA